MLDDIHDLPRNFLRHQLCLFACLTGCFRQLQ
jgi:hypothetical protein